MVGKSAQHVIVVDDDSQICTMLRTILEREGYRVSEASNGKSAVKIARQDPPDLLVTDIIMPEQEGLQTIIEMRSNFPDTRIIAISGGGRFGPDKYLEAAAELGAHATIEKPLRARDFADTVRGVLAAPSLASSRRR